MENRCLCAQTRRASRRTTQIYDGFLKPTGLRVTQYSLLAKIERHRELPVTKLAQVMMMDQSTMTRNLKLLEKKGYVHFEKAEDQRIRRTSLTDSGREALRKARPFWEKAQSHVSASLGSQRTARLLNDLEKIAGMNPEI